MNELLTCEGLTKSYQKGTNALDDIELHIGFGRIVGLLGPNGSGKTTLLRSIYRTQKMDSGIVRLDDEDITHFSGKKLARNMAVMGQFNQINFDYTVLDIALMGRYPFHSLLEQEKERTDFYAAQCGGIRFDYDLLAGSVTVYDYHAEPMQQKTVTDFAQGRGLGFLNEQDRRKLSKAISRATPEAPDVVLPVMVKRDGEPRLHRMALHTIWSGAGVRRCVNVLGQLTDEQHRVEHQAELLTALDPEEDPAHFLRRLQGIFDVVRLVDPGHRKVLTLDSDGILTEKPGSCHMVWNRDTRCENCISAKAYARKTILNKIEFKDEEAYFVISKYIEVGGRGCMLELVTRLTDGRWLDMGGHRLLLDRCDGMERSAFVDPLTGAYTRRYFDKFLASGEMSGGVAMIDVDQFKAVNDSFGHLVGDEALKTVAEAMQNCLRQTDILIRYGGDEFLLLMPQSRPNGVESVIRRVQDAVQAARVPSHPELRLSVSIGGVCDVQPLTEAIRQADVRMYRNKENG